MRNNPKLMMQMLPDSEDIAEEIPSQKQKSKIRRRLYDAKQYESHNNIREIKEHLKESNDSAILAQSAVPVQPNSKPKFTEINTS